MRSNILIVDIDQFELVTEITNKKHGMCPINLTILDMFRLNFLNFIKY